MSKILKILSIDFDYFVGATEDQIRLYFPDPIDVPPEISTNIWNIHYLTQGKEIQSIELRRDEYYKLISKLQSDITADLCIFSYTHKDIIRGIEYLIQDEKFNKIIINHIDSHPDTGEITYDEVHCGNWVTHLKSKNKKVDVRWISNEMVYEMQIVNNELLSSTKFGIDNLTNIKHYDLIFLCRSDQWTPPHLDKYFTELVHAVRVTRSSGVISSIEPRKLNY